MRVRFLWWVFLFVGFTTFLGEVYRVRLSFFGDLDFIFRAVFLEIGVGEVRRVGLIFFI